MEFSSIQESDLKPVRDKKRRRGETLTRIMMRITLVELWTWIHSVSIYHHLDYHRYQELYHCTGIPYVWLWNRWRFPFCARGIRWGQEIEIKQLEKRKTRRETKRRGHKGLGENGERDKDRGENIQFETETNGEQEWEGSASPSSFKWMKSAPFWLNRELQAGST